MRYVSTRGGMRPAEFSDTVIAGLAPDGGLTTPYCYPVLYYEELDEIRNLNYQDLAINIISRFATDIPENDLERLVRKTYTRRSFKTGEITPVTEIDNGIYLQDLSINSDFKFKLTHML